MTSHKFSHGVIYYGDCLDLMQAIPDGSVDMILADLPYGTTDCKWDSIIPLDVLWNEYKRISKETATIALTAQQPFTSILVCSNMKEFRHRWVWEKDKGANFQCIKYQPYKRTEDIVIFQKYGYLKPWNDGGTIKGIYNPQMRIGAGNSRKKAMGKWTPKSKNMLQINDRKSFKGTHSMNTNDSSKQRYPIDIIYFPVPWLKNRIHPTQKPVKLFEYLIRTYTNKGDLILDNVIGSGTTAIAAYNTGRKFIGMEKDEEIYSMAVNRIDNETRQLKLFENLAN